MDQFNEGDYIVAVTLDSGTRCAKVNWVFKQRTNSKYMAPVIDLVGDEKNGNGTLLFTGGKWTWRYATEAEAKKYDRLGKPYETDPILSLTGVEAVLNSLDELEKKYSNK